jgi:arylsulfatase A-like enzyme
MGSMVGAGTSPGPTRRAFSLKNNSLPRIPALQARAPDGLRGHTVDTPVSAGIDIRPTLVDCAGYDVRNFGLSPGRYPASCCL